jgi:hypothetical protein
MPLQRLMNHHDEPAPTSTACPPAAGLYCHPSLRQWGSYDFSTGQFVLHDAAAAAAAAAPGYSGAAQGALARGSAQLYSSRQEQLQGQGAPRQHLTLAAQQQQQQQGQQPLRAKRGAVIGASAQLDAQGLLEAARAAEERVQLLRKQKEMEDAKRKAAAKKEQAKQQQRAAAGGAAGVVDVKVQGVIHQSSWAAARRQQQQQQGQG